MNEQRPTPSSSTPSSGVATAGTTDSQPGTRPMRPILIAAGLFALALVATFVLIASRGEDAAALDATKLALELSYPAGAAPQANLNGQPDAAPAGSSITCRATSSRRRIGQGRANDEGAFDIALDAALWPLESLTREGYPRLNESLECRAGSGEWVHPLRQPRVRIN